MMTTALVNENGKIVMPVLVTGTIPSPKVESDVSAMARMRTGGPLPNTLPFILWAVGCIPEVGALFRATGVGEWGNFRFALDPGAIQVRSWQI